MSDTLLSAWHQTVAAAPSAVALIDDAGGHRWTRADIDRESIDWHRVHGSDTRGQTIAFAEPNGAGWLRVFLGLLRGGAVALPLDPGEPVPARRATALSAGATFLSTAGQLESLRPRHRPARDGRRLVKLTSGSTGTPRALRFTDAQLLADGRQICAAMKIAPTDLNLGLIPWGHSYGLGNLVLPLLLQGTAVVCNAPPLPHAIAACVARHRVTVFPAVPALLRALADSTIPTAQLASLRTVISAGAPLAPQVAQAFHAHFGRKVHSFYGSSETGGISYDAGGEAALTGRSVGRPLPGVRLQFARARRFAVRGPAVFTIGNRRRGTHLMPDLGELNEAGELVLLGRTGRFVKIAGRRVNLAEVESVLKQLPGVRDAFVGPHPERAEALAAVVATDDPSADLRAALRDRLAAWKLPRRIVALPTFPLTARGKTDTHRLRELLRQQNGSGSAV
jgi:acyl-coenzyme A synthetase/AMP-(fatty) acid ligase